jgi:hypothetical protein
LYVYIRIRNTQPSTADPSSNNGGGISNAEHEFSKDIDINDCRNRYALTKGVTQQQIKKDFNAGKNDTRTMIAHQYHLINHSIYWL